MAQMGCAHQCPREHQKKPEVDGLVGYHSSLVHRSAESAKTRTLMATCFSSTGSTVFAIVSKWTPVASDMPATKKKKEYKHYCNNRDGIKQIKKGSKSTRTKGTATAIKVHVICTPIRGGWERVLVASYGCNVRDKVMQVSLLTADLRSLAPAANASAASFKWLRHSQIGIVHTRSASTR